MTFHTIRLELARDHDNPEGNAARGYRFTAPLDKNARLDGAAWARDPARATVTRFWDGELTELGYLVRRTDGEWVFDYDPEDEDDDEPGYRFGAHRFAVGEYVSIREHDGVTRTFRIASAEPTA